MANLILKEQRPQLVRYVTALHPHGVSIHEERYIGVLESEHTMWIISETVNKHMLEREIERYVNGDIKIPKYIFGQRLRRVKKGADASFAHIDRKKAWTSFRRRQAARLHKVNMQLAQVEKALTYLNDHSEPPAPESADHNYVDGFRIDLGHTEFTEHEVYWE